MRRLEPLFFAIKRSWEISRRKFNQLIQIKKAFIEEDNQRAHELDMIEEQEDETDDLLQNMQIQVVY